MKIAIVLTTINIPKVIEKYISNALSFNRKDIVFIIIGDKKTPDLIDNYLKSLASTFPIEYLDIERQLKFLSLTPKLRDFIPYNSVQRRNVGYLFAHKEYKPDIIITIDDDNFPFDDIDFFGDHSVINNYIEAQELVSSNNWVNSCSLLQTNPARTYYHRGYPVSKRIISETSVRETLESKKVLVNAGLWLGDPDVDTISRLDSVSKVISVDPKSYLVKKGCLCPFNSQNTSFSSELISCIFLPTLPPEIKTSILKNNNNFRYDDIWMSFFTKLCLDKMNAGLLIGKPIVEQIRNEHDLFLDLEKELIPMKLTDILADDILAISPKGNNIIDCYSSITDQLEIISQNNSKINSEEKHIMSYFIQGMRIWMESI